MATLSPEQKVILDIRSKNGVEEALLQSALLDPELRETIIHLKGEAARGLNILSDELSAKPAHCVLEIIQNAVDNSYPEGVLPTLEIELRPSHLQIWCNEVGFEEDHVRAFCSIGNSTKKNKRGYIGEKGIGAKSMFKVANKVTVQSRGYSFLLDREKELGMISPIWYNGPVPADRRGWTGITLEFGPNKPFDDLKTELVEIRDYILLFLPNLSILKINVDGSPFTIERAVTDTRVLLKTTIDTCTTSKIFLRTAKIVRVPVPDPRREGQVETEVVLAFPLQNDGHPDFSIQANIHAFLPLRRVGFKFVVQADFLTSANREDVLTNSRWNRNIRDSLSSAFVDAVEVMRVTPSLEFTWPRFLPQEHDIADAFFKVAAEDIPRLLKTRPIIKCSDGTDRLPSQVRLVNGFVDGEGQPLVPAQDLAFHYASTEYQDDVERMLVALVGVTDMSFSEFLTGLLGMVAHGRFSHTDNVWLENVCYILDVQGISRIKIGKGWKDEVVDVRILQLPLIQLKDSTWTTCTNCQEYFFAPSKASFPSGLNIQVVNFPFPGAARRRSLLRKLGVRDIEEEDVVQRIVELHNSVIPPSFNATLEHIVYLYQHQAVLRVNIKHFCLYDGLGNAHKGDQLFMDDAKDNDPDRLSLIFEGTSAIFVHERFCRPPAILQGLARNSAALVQWQEWLIAVFGVRTVPPVVNGLPTPEFATIIKSLQTSDTPRLLRILRRFWDRFISQTSREELLTLRNYFRSLEVRCEGGRVAALHATFFPSETILKYGVGSLPLLDLGDASGDWSFLGSLGVSMEPDGRFFLKKLMALSQTSAVQVDPSAVTGLYEQISSRFVEFGTDATAAFSQNPLVLLDGKWHRSTDVVWKAPPYFKLKPALEEQYQSLKVFFKDQLRLKDAPPGTIAEELREFSSAHKFVKPNSPELSRLKDLLRHASQSVDSIRKGQLADWTSKIRGFSLFPVKSPSDKPGTPLKLMAATDSFFVQDASGQLSIIFRDLVPLLALDLQQLYESTSFLEHVGILPGKRLNESVSRTVEINRQPIATTSSWAGHLSTEESEYINTRLPYIQRFLYYKRNKKLLEFTELRVYKVSSIKVTWSLRQPNLAKINLQQTWVDIRDGIVNIFVVNDATATESGLFSLAEKLANALDIDLPFMMQLTSANIGLIDGMMGAMGIGALATAADDTDKAKSTSTVSPGPPPAEATPQVAATSQLAATPQVSVTPQVTATPQPQSVAPSAPRFELPPAAKTVTEYINTGAAAVHSATTPATTTPAIISPQQSTSILPAVGRRREEVTQFNVPTQDGGYPFASRLQEPFVGQGEVVFNWVPPQPTASPSLPIIMDSASTNRPFPTNAMDRRPQRPREYGAPRTPDVVSVPEQPQQPAFPQTSYPVAVGQPPTLDGRPVSAATPAASVESIVWQLPREAYRRPLTRFTRMPPTAVNVEAALQIGLIGELHVFDFLSIELGLPNFTVDNWTSELRNGIPDLPPFVGISYADFRYHDLTGELTRQLLPHQPEIHGATPEIFIEVKATTGTQDEIFHMSPLQLRYAAAMWRGRNPNTLPTQLYVLFRLSNIGHIGGPSLNAHVDVHDHFVRGVLRIESQVDVRICT